MKKVRFSMEERMDVNPIYAETPLKMLLFGFVSGQQNNSDISVLNSVRNFIRFLGIEGDEWTFTTNFTNTKYKFYRNIDPDEVNRRLRDFAITTRLLEKTEDDCDITIRSILNEFNDSDLRSVQRHIEQHLKD